jgi:hypothetical protein
LEPEQASVQTPDPQSTFMFLQLWLLVQRTWQLYTSGQFSVASSHAWSPKHRALQRHPGGQFISRSLHPCVVLQLNTHVPVLMSHVSHAAGQVMVPELVGAGS